MDAICKYNKLNKLKSSKKKGGIFSPIVYRFGGMAEW